MKNSLLLDGRTYHALMKHLRRNDAEQSAFLYWEPDGDNYSVREIRFVTSEELIGESSEQLQVSGEVIAEVIAKAHVGNFGVAEVHTHPLSKKGVKFSATDFRGFESFVPHMIWRLKGRTFIAIVVGQSDYDALVWNGKDVYSPLSLAGIEVDGNPLPVTNNSYEIAMELKRLERQRIIFGAEGQARMSSRRVAVVGLGGIGSIVTHELAYLGVKAFTLIDGDNIERTNLNRLLGAFPDDLGRLKIDVMAEFITRLNPLADVAMISKMLPANEAITALQEVDFVFGCVDNDGPRLELLSLCAENKIPYIDLASDIPEDSLPGGRMVFSGIGNGCLFCREELSQEEVREYYMTDEQRRDNESIYGVRHQALEGGGPSVITLNGIVASLGATEFMAYCTGMRSPEPYLAYRGRVVHGTRDIPARDCQYCVSYLT